MSVTPERAAKVAEARRLRAEGLTWREIGARMGLACSTVGDLLGDPDRTVTLRRRARYAGRCEVCGKATDGSNGAKGAPKRCPAHSASVEKSRERSGTGPNQRWVLALLAQRPLRYSDIRDALAVSSSHASVLLNQMLRYGLIERVSRGLYRLPERP